MALLGLDRPVTVQQDREGTLVGRHYEDGSMRTTLFRPDGQATVFTTRTDPSTGAVTTTRNRPDGSVETDIELPSGDRILTRTEQDGSVLRVETFTDESGNPSTRTTHPDGGVETTMTWVDDRGTTHTTHTLPNGSTEVTEVTSLKLEDGTTHTATVVLGGNGDLIRRTDTDTKPDGSAVTTVRTGAGASHVESTTYESKMPDGATRYRTVHDDGTDETMIHREYDKDGKHIVEVMGEDSVHTTVTGPDFDSDTFKYDDGTTEAVDRVSMPDGRQVVTQTHRDGSWTSTEQLPVTAGEPARSVTTSSDGSRVEQTFDDHMTSIITRPDGSRTEIRLDPDGDGTTAEFDTNGEPTFLDRHDGADPLEPRGGLLGDDGLAPATTATAPADAVAADPTAGPVPDPSPADAPGGMDPVFAQAADDSATTLIASDGTASSSLDEDLPGGIAPAPDLEEAPELDDYAETVNVAYSVTEAPDGTTIEPDPDAPLPVADDGPLETWPDDSPIEDDGPIELDDYAETVNVAYSVTEAPDGTTIEPDPDVPLPVAEEGPLETWPDAEPVELDTWSEAPPVELEPEVLVEEPPAVPMESTTWEEQPEGGIVDAESEMPEAW